MALAHAPTFAIRAEFSVTTPLLLHVSCNKIAPKRADISTVMLVALAALWIPLKPLDFPPGPLPAEVARGVEVYVEGKGLERLYNEDRQVVGTWFDGTRKRDADHVLWISPALASRWLGYLEVKEKWPPGERESRWKKLKASLAGKLTFVVRLCAMPKVDLVEQELAGYGMERDALDVRFLWTSASSEWPVVRSREGLLGWSRPRTEPQRDRPADSLRAMPQSCLLREHRSRSSSRIFAEDWWRRVPFGESLTPEFDRGSLVEDLPLGDFFAATYLVQLPIPKESLPSGGFELRVFNARRERVAAFSLFPAKAQRMR
jgi:hypothetical protein